MHLLLIVVLKFFVLLLEEEEGPFEVTHVALEGFVILVEVVNKVSDKEKIVGLKRGKLFIATFFSLYFLVNLLGFSFLDYLGRGRLLYVRLMDTCDRV